MDTTPGFSIPKSAWVTIILAIYLHTVSLHAIVFDVWRAGWKTLVFNWMYLQLCAWGVTAGAHRLWSHRSYKAKTSLKVALMLWHTAAGIVSLKAFVREHRVHHKHTDTDADPHDSRRGFFFSHIGWLMRSKRPEVLEAGKALDYSDVLSDPVVCWHERNLLFLRIMLVVVLPTMIPVLCWGESLYLAWSLNVLRWTIGWNIVGSVNSLAHMYGAKPYNRDIRPSENALVSLLSSGEGWHNYHHTFPWDYRTSEHGFLNCTTLFLDACGRLGLASDFKTASPALVKRTVQQNRDKTQGVPHSVPWQPAEPEEARTL